MPELRGRIIQVTVAPSLTAHRGKLLSGSKKGVAVLAGTFLRKREIVVEQQLLRTPREFSRIFVHEVFHFVWSRLDANRRLAFEALLQREWDKGARGELGWSAESMKLALTSSDVENRTRRWKDYACESFCDTGGWAFGSSGRYAEMTLARTHRERRWRWFLRFLLIRPLAI